MSYPIRSVPLVYDLPWPAAGAEIIKRECSYLVFFTQTIKCNVNGVLSALSAWEIQLVLGPVT